MADTVFENPDGFFIANSYEIAQIKVNKIDDRGAYSVRLYLLTSNNPDLRIGLLVGGGWWIPTFRQFYVMPYLEFPNRTECSGWWKEEGSWSGLIVADDKIPIGSGKTCSGYKSTKDAPPNRQPKDHQPCKSVRVEGYGCFRKCTEWYEDDSRGTYYIRKRSDAFSIYRYLNSAEYSKTRKQPTSTKQEPKGILQSNSSPNFAGSWKGTVDNQPIEMVLWPKPNKHDQFRGVVYLPKHDCLMPAYLNKYDDQFVINFGNFKATGFKNNCMLNVASIKGSYKNNFNGSGAVTIDYSSDVLNLNTRSLCLGKPIAGTKTQKEIIINFRKTPASAKMLEIINNYKDKGIGRPDAKFLSEIIE